ncbi:hypothetical protein PMAYCL1PPCAC_26990, partial [Pristionchus mayeri]
YSTELSLCANLLHVSAIEHLQLLSVTLNDTTAPLIISIISRATNFLSLHVRRQHQFADPAAFIEKLSSMSIAGVFFSDPSSHANSFFALTHLFWEKFLNDKLSNGSLEWVVTGNTNGKIMKAPLNLPATPIGYLEWQKVKGE